MTKAQAVTAPETGQESNERALEQGKFSPFTALAALKSQVRVLEVSASVETPTVVEVAVQGVEVGCERTFEENTAMIEEMRALLAALSIDGTESTAEEEVAVEPKAPTRVIPPKAPEGVSRNIGELFALFDAKNVVLPKRFWFYIVSDGKCGTATLKLVRSKSELAVIVVAAEGDLPEYLREFRKQETVITLEVLVHPERLGDDEMSRKAKQLAAELTGIHHRMARARSRNRRNGK